MVFRIIIGFLHFLLVACGERSSSPHRRETRITRSQIEEVMANQKFECASLGGVCPGGLARILIVDETDSERSAVCSGFMVSATRLVTNHHCIPTASKCANTYIAVYNGADYEQRRCKFIIKTEQDVDDPNDPARKLDYTVMEIDRIYSGEFFELSRANTIPGDRAHAWVIDHTGLDRFPSNLNDVRITELECMVSGQTERASLLLQKCPIIKGNSGSPALNRSGEVVGVIWGGSATEMNSALDLLSRRRTDGLGLATEASFFSDFVLLFSRSLRNGYFTVAR